MLLVEQARLAIRKFVSLLGCKVILDSAFNVIVFLSVPGEFHFAAFLGHLSQGRRRLAQLSTDEVDIDYLNSFGLAVRNHLLHHILLFML